MSSRALSSRSFTHVILAAGLIAELAGCDRQSSPPTQPQGGAASAPAAEPLSGTLDRSHKGARLPDLSFHTADGQVLRLPSLVGKPLLINFWATWCGPCLAELPTLHRLAARPGLTVVAISEDLGAPDKVSAFWAQHGFAGWPAWLDPDNAATSHYMLQTMPTTVYYDARGHELWRFTGGRNWASPESAALLAEGRPG